MPDSVQRLVDAFIANTRRENLNILYVRVLRDGEIAGTWQRFSRAIRLESFSASKSFVGVGVGIAADEGLLSLDETVADFFPEELDGVSDPNVLSVTVRDLLRMTVGLAGMLFQRDSDERANAPDWTRHIFTQGRYVRPPGQAFLYSNSCTYLLGRMVGKRYGRNLHEYLRHRLFAPLGIGNPDMTICPQGHTVGANGMAISADELGRFGRMVLQQGEYGGTRIVSAAYLKAATRFQVETGKRLPRKEEGTLGYGYHFWVDPVRNAPFLWGVYGQYCIIMPDRNAVVTVQSLEENDAAVGLRIWTDILDKLQEEYP